MMRTLTVVVAVVIFIASHGFAAEDLAKQSQNADAPDNGPEWVLQFMVKLLFPK